MKYIFALLLVLKFNIAYGLNWSIEGDFPLEEKKQLQQRYPEIKQPSDLEGLMEHMAILVSVKSMRSYYENNQWTILVETERVVSHVKFVTFTNQYQNQLKGISAKYLGKTDSKELRRDLLTETFNFLVNKGWPNSKVEMKIPSSGELVYQIYIDEDEPCFIDEINIAFPLPDDISFNMKPRDLCDRNLLTDAVDDLEDQLKDKGYVDLKLNHYRINYVKGKTRGIINVMGVLGPVMKYEINNEEDINILSRIFSGNELKGLKPNRVDPDAMEVELKKRFQEKGFADVSVKKYKKQDTEEKIVYLYEVKPGIQYQVGNITIEGSTIFSRPELIEALGLNQFWGGNITYNFEEIQNGVENLKGSYQQRGYWRVIINEPRTTKDESTGLVDLTFVIDEENIRLMGNLEFKGMEAFSKEEVKDLLKVERGEPLDHNSLISFQQELRKLYLNEGYNFSSINLTTKENPGRKEVYVETLVEVTENSRVKIGSIQIKGLTRTKKYVVEREILFSTGEWFDPRKVEATRKALIELGIFRSVHISTANIGVITSNTDRTNIVVNVSEGNSGNIVFGPGYDIQRGFAYSAEASYNNIAGTGRQFSISGKISEEKHQHGLDDKTLIGRKVGVGYVEPHIFNSSLDGRVSLSHRATADQYWQFVHKGELALVRKLRTFSAESEVVGFYARSINRADGKSGQARFHVISDAKIGSVGLRFNRDARDNKGWPTMGSFFSSEVSWARYPLGGDLKYFRWDMTSNRYVQIQDRFVLAAGVSFTSYRGIEVDGTPLGLLPSASGLSAGGPDMVRGFQEQLGPYIRRPVENEDEKLSGYEEDIIGGDQRIIIKTELRYLINPQFGLSLFIDSGNAFLSNGQANRFYKLLDKENEKGTNKASLEDNYQIAWKDLIQDPSGIFAKNYSSIGTALKILTPIGSIDIAYAIPWKEPPVDSCDGGHCLRRGKKTSKVLLSGQWVLSVGARF